MTDNAGVSGVAEGWVRALLARGATLVARGAKRVAVFPKSVYSAMSDDEFAVLRRHRVEIAALINERYGGIARPQTAPIAPIAPPPAPEPPPTCSFCMAPCCGEGHPAFDTLHARDEAAYWRRRDRQRQHDFEEFLVRQRYGLRPHQW